MYKKVYIISVSSQNTEENIKKFKNLGEALDIRDMWDSYYLLGRNNNKNCLRDLHTMEYYMFRKFLINKGYKTTDIKILVAKPMFILNEELYLFEDFEWKKIDIENVAFYSIRGDSWSHPFFVLLKNLLKSKGGFANSVGGFNGKIQKKNKFFAYSTLYPNNKNIGTLGIPFNLNEESLGFLAGLIKRKMGDNILIKIDATSFGVGVIPIDLNNGNNFEKFKNGLNSHMKYGNEIYIVPLKEFKVEYRVYFSKTNGKVKIHSMKEKNITTSKEEILKKDNYKYYKNVNLEWKYIENKNWDKEVIDIIEGYIKGTDYPVGNLEFGKVLDENAKKNEYIFFEINYMAGPGCYSGFNNEDINNMSEFYEEVFNKTYNAI